MKQPKVLLADEPTGNLDESTRDEIMDVLIRMWKELGLTFVMVTHDSALAKQAPRVATIRKGRITVQENARGVTRGSVTEFRRPCNSRPTDFLPSSHLLST
ncbi:hypothetical protein SPURM210S_07741 [Streptomyces purpurascens]